LERNLILITNHFPFGPAESFLESEIGHHMGSFGKVVILARDVTSHGQRKLPAGVIVERVNPQSGVGEMLTTMVQILVRLPQIIALLREEISSEARSKSFSTAKLRTMLHDVVKATTTAWHLERLVRKHALNGDLYLYSYWLNSSALSTLLVRHKGRVICFSRAHGGDVYEFRHPGNYLSFRPTYLRRLDRIFTISDSARQHLLKSDPAAANVSVSRLGVTKTYQPPERRSNEDWVILSCSFMVAVKRIHLAIEAISQIADFRIKWIHIGDGPLKEELLTLAKMKLQGNPQITYSFAGVMEYQELMKFYRDNYVDVFLNTSSSEGIPVTMMEAQSFSIPVIAPDVGGIGEIVIPGTGIRFPADATSATIARTLEKFMSLPSDERSKMRSNAFRNWETRYNAEKNFPTFVAEILNL
jgi:glycosyltransferase involved in cell wall biosynthesis